MALGGQHHGDRKCEGCVAWQVHGEVVGMSVESRANVESGLRQVLHRVCLGGGE